MHSSATLAVILLAASAASAAPANVRQALALTPEEATRVFLGGEQNEESFAGVPGVVLPPRALTARGSAFLDILKPLGTGLLGGGAVAALDHFIGGGDKSGSSKRQLPPPTFSLVDADKANAQRIHDEIVNHVTRSIVGSLLGATEDSLGTVLKTSAAAGLASGAVGAAGSALEGLFGHKDSSSKRELPCGPDPTCLLEPDTPAFQAFRDSLNLPGARSLIGSVLGATEDSLGTVLKTSAAAGLASGAVGAAGSALEGLFGHKDSSSKRFIRDPFDVPDIDPSIISPHLGPNDPNFVNDPPADFFSPSAAPAPAGSASRRGVNGIIALGTEGVPQSGPTLLDLLRDGQLTAPASRRGIIALGTEGVPQSGPSLLDLLRDGHFTAPASRRELDERLNLGPIEKGILGTVTGLGVSSAASGILDKVFGNGGSSRRDVTPEQALAAVLLSGRSFNELD